MGAGLAARAARACALLAALGLAAALWASAALSRLLDELNTAGRDSEGTIAAASLLTSALEREDDALLALLGRPHAGRPLDGARRTSDQASARLRALLTSDDELRAAAAIEASVGEYRESADRLLDGAEGGSLERYRLEANPRLRLAVAAVGQVRDHHVDEARASTALARAEIARVRGSLLAASLLAALLAALASLWLARRLAAPLRGLARGGDALREGRPVRVEPCGDDDLDRVALALGETSDRLDDLRRLDEQRAELIAVVSHELRTPVTTLQLSLQLLREASPDEMAPRCRELVSTALGGVEQLAETVDELLDTTRLEAGRLRLSLEPVDLAALASAAVERWRPRCEEQGVALALHAPPGLGLARGDRARLRVVLDNLLSNALKYTPRGGRVSVEVSRLDAGEGRGGLLHLAVTDSGPGVPVEFRSRVFEKFFRVEHHRPGSEESPQGTGIGLYFCKEIVELHGGTIACEAGPGGDGTSVAVRLPLFAA